jgi:multiple sugar transport system ATP-binding protein
MVFQSYALYPHMTVASNLGFALRLARVPKAERERKVREAARILQLESLLDRRPGQLSGGQRQRVAIGRAIVRQPKVFLFDEPLSNLDAALRVQMRVELARLHRELDTTMIYVTHDQVEAMTMADRIVVLRAGVVEQTGTPLELYNEPANEFVAGFIGSPKMNFLPVKVAASDGHGVTVALPGGSRVDLRLASPAAAGTEMKLGIRPEGVVIDPAGPVAGQVSVVEHLGSETLVYVDVGEGNLLTVKSAPNVPAAVGDSIRLSLEGTHLHAFDREGRSLRWAGGAR